MGFSVVIAISKIESLVYFYSQFSCVYVSIFKLYYRDSCLPIVKQVDKMGCACVPAKLLQLCLTLCDLMDCSLPGSYVHGIIQARILVWDAMPSSRGSSRIRDQTHTSCIRKVGSLSLSHQKSPYLYLFTFKTNFSYEKFLILLSSLSSPSPLLCG